MRAKALLATCIALADACFFWEGGECDLAEQMCGREGIIVQEPEENRCHQFIQMVNHANEECAPSDSTNVTIDEYRECFYDEISTHTSDRAACGGACRDAWPMNVTRQFECYAECIHIHGCLKTCGDKKYKYRHAIHDCLEECSSNSPAAHSNTCQGRCNGHSPNRQCWCDASCVYLEDCCSDYDNQCLAKGLTVLEPPNVTFGLPGLNVSQQSLATSKYKKNFTVTDPSEIGINTSEYPLVDAPNASFNGSAIVVRNKTAPMPKETEEDDNDVNETEVDLDLSPPSTTTTTTMVVVNDAEDAQASPVRYVTDNTEGARPTVSDDSQITLIAISRRAPSSEEGPLVPQASRHTAAAVARTVRLRGHGPSR